MECHLPSGTALGAKRQQDKSGIEKGQRHQGTHQQHQKTSQVSKAQLNSKTTLKGIRYKLSTFSFVRLPILLLGLPIFIYPPHTAILPCTLWKPLDLFIP